MSILGTIIVVIVVVVVALVLLSTGLLNSLISGAASHAGGIVNPTVVVSGYAKTNLGTYPIRITFGSSTTTVDSNGYYSVTLNNDQVYPITIGYAGATGNSNCSAGTLNLQASSGSYAYNATC